MLRLPHLRMYTTDVPAYAAIGHFAPLTTIFHVFYAAVYVNTYLRYTLPALHALLRLLCRSFAARYVFALPTLPLCR